MQNIKSGHKQASVRISNRQLVLELLRSSEEVTISQIAEQIHLSKTTLWKIIDHFIGENLVLPSGKAQASEEGGKKPDLFRFNERYGYVISISVFGTSIQCALTDAKAVIFYKEIIFIQKNEQLSRIIEIIAGFIKKWQEPSTIVDRHAKLLGVVIAASGVVDSKNGIIFTASRFNSWEQHAPFRKLIEQQVELKAPFYIDNYNRYIAFAEKSLGCAKDKNNIIVITAGFDGLGGGIIAEGVLKRGPRYLTGEVGHMRLDPSDTEVCHCGGRGCFEQLISPQRMIRRAETLRNEYLDSMLYAPGAGAVTLKSIFSASNAGDKLACLLIDGVVEWFAMAIANINLVFNSEIYILSGDYRNAGPFFLRRLREKTEQQSLLRMEKRMDIRYSEFDDEGAILGGSSYALNQHFSTIIEY